MSAYPLLWHYTCAHGRMAIGDKGVLQPNSHPLLGGPPVVWLSDLMDPDRDALGLTSTLLRCDRTEYRYRVLPESGQALPWAEWWPRYDLDHEICSVLESYAQPQHWWISETPIRCRLSQRSRRYVSL